MIIQPDQEERLRRAEEKLEYLIRLVLAYQAELKQVRNQLARATSGS